MVGGTLVAACAAVGLALVLTSSDGDDGTPAATSTKSTTADASTTTTEVDYSAAVAGLLTTPDGVPQANADAFAADLTAALDGSGWPELERQASIDLLQEGLDIAVTGCRLLDSSDDLGPAATEGIAQYATTTLLPDLTRGIEAVGVPSDTAGELASGFIVGVYEAAGRHVCPQHAQVLADATRGL